ncbi:MAG: hypothetical protein K8S99_05435 [Planctomycetes bacterium]|nr:hypothetical protein [Planctomycetota bacterium]
MSVTTTLRQMQEQAGASFVPYGPAGGGAVEMVETFGFYEGEYAAIRRGVGLLHMPQRGVLRFTGKDRAEFLHAMLTQDIRGMTGGATRRGFQLNSHGRIVADVIIHHGDLDTWLELDAIDIPALKALLEGRLFSEEVVIEDWSERYTAVSLHGPAVLPLLRRVIAEDPAKMIDMPGTHHVLTLNGQYVTAYRWDECGVTGVRLLIPREHEAELVQALAAPLGGLNPEPAPTSPEEKPGEQKIRGRGIGWLAFNTARIEAGSPLFHIDFGPDTLPHETGILAATASFTKGCYLGQEIVARMQNLGHPKKVLVGLKFEDDRLPIAGAQVFEPAEAAGVSGTVIGGVTSSTLAPMLGGKAVALAMMKWGKHRAGTRAAVPAEGGMAPAVVQGLSFLNG